MQEWGGGAGGGAFFLGGRGGGGWGGGEREGIETPQNETQTSSEPMMFHRLLVRRGI